MTVAFLQPESDSGIVRSSQMACAFGRVAKPAPEQAPLSLFSPSRKAIRFKLHPNSVGDGDDRASHEFESRQHRTERMHLERDMTLRSTGITTPITDADDERKDLEIGRYLPGAKTPQRFASVRMSVLDGRGLRTFVPRDHVLDRTSALGWTETELRSCVASKV